MYLDNLQEGCVSQDQEVFSIEYITFNLIYLLTGVHNSESKLGCLLGHGFLP